ncbi:MAG TPA: hypothetical protein VG963_02910, partial [Polyangiaceae bacterium]|nr:hypothetical protein [Polyangiaceae bacterium]
MFTGSNEMAGSSEDRAVRDAAAVAGVQGAHRGADPASRDGHTCASCCSRRYNSEQLSSLVVVSPEGAP